MADFSNRELCDLIGRVFAQLLTIVIYLIVQLQFPLFFISISRQIIPLWKKVFFSSLKKN